MKYSKLLFGFIAILGIVFLTLVLAGLYLDYVDAASILASLNSRLGLWFVLGGIVFLTVGVIGMGRQHFKNHRNIFTALAVLLIPLLTLAIMFVASVLVIVYAPMFPMRSEITQVSLISTSPLILSVDVKAITSRDTAIEGANIMDYNDDNRVAYCPLKPFIELPAGPTKTLTLNFNTTLPSGSYIVRLVSWESHHGSSPFTIP